jgi:FdhD protein
MKTGLNIVKFQQFRSGNMQVVEGELIVESPVALFVNSELWLTFMCTPNNLEALALGFLYNEGVINSLDQVVDIHICDSGDIIDVWLGHHVEKPNEWKRTSGCTGGFTAIDLQSITPEINNGMSLESDKVRHLVESLFDSQQLYRKTGGVHTSILTDGDREIILAEDVGRHNTLDKIAGKCLLEKINLTKKILLTTGRVSSDMLQKSTRIGASIVISRTSPTSMSIELADKWGITLIGYARRDRFNLYTHPGRIIESDSKEVSRAKRSASP